MGEIVVNSRVLARFKLSRFDRFEARNRPLCIYLSVIAHLNDTDEQTESETERKEIY